MMIIDYNIIKNYVLNLGINVFERYMRRIVNSSFYNDTKKALILSTYSNIITDLSYEEKIQLGLYV